MKKRFLTVFLAFLCGINVFAAEPKAKTVALEACRQSSVEESISYIKSKLSAVTVPAEKRSLYIFMATLQEQMSDYENAQKNFATAAGISAGDADGMPQKSNEQLVIDAVRCALCIGDYATADSYLASSIRNSKNEEIISYVKLYSQWSALCKASTSEEIREPVELLKAYLNVPSMKKMQPAILLTLWYITGDGSLSKQLLSDFPSSTEASIVKGDVQLLPVPFWFFVPKSGVAEMGTGTYSESSETKKSSVVTTKFTKWQLGLFKSESNAKLLCDEVKSKGIEAYVQSETRASGTTYYLVFVNENKDGNVADQLRSAGYECYPVE